jgi:hypothetical protein
MTDDDPIALDEHRGMAAQRATDIRRRRGEVAADQAELRRRQQELEKFLLVAPSATWVEVAEKAHYLITLFAETAGHRISARSRSPAFSMIWTAAAQAGDMPGEGG